MKTYTITREIKRYLSKTVTVADDMHEDDVIETAWNDPSPWMEAGSRDMNVELEET